MHLSGGHIAYYIICLTCFAAKEGAAETIMPQDTACKGKRKVDGSCCGDGDVEKKRNTGSERCKPRKRLALGLKIEVLELLLKKVSHSEIARRYGCSMRTVSSIAHNKVTIMEMSESAGYDKEAKNARKGSFPEVQHTRCYH